MSLESVAERYAHALFEIGSEQGNLSALADEIRRIGAVYAESHELRSVIENPLVEEGPRAAVLAEIATRLGAGPITKNTLAMLAKRHRLAILPHMAKALDRLADERAGVVRAVVTSAAALSDAYCQKLKEQLEKRTGKKIVLEKSVDPTLLGGVVTRIGDRVIDGSLRSRFASMKAVLAQS